MLRLTSLRNLAPQRLTPFALSRVSSVSVAPSASFFSAPFRYQASNVPVQSSQEQQQQQQQQQDSRAVARRDPRSRRGNVARWDPFLSPMLDFPFFSDNLFSFPSFWGLPEEAQRAPVSPALEVSENSKAFVVQVDLPGVKKDNIRIKVTGEKNRVLTISAERKMELDEEEAGQQQQQQQQSQQQSGASDSQQTPTTPVKSFTHSRFTRSIRLPDTVDPDKIQAKYEDGVLRLTIPKMAKKEQPERTISVE